MTLAMIIALSSAIAIGLGTIGTGIGQGVAIGHAMEAMGRNPEASKTVQTNMLIGLAFVESLCIYALVVALLLLFLKWPTT